jgi:hypothetical protein
LSRYFNPRPPSLSAPPTKPRLCTLPAPSSRPRSSLPFFLSFSTYLCFPLVHPRKYHFSSPSISWRQSVQSCTHRECGGRTCPPTSATAAKASRRNPRRCIPTDAPPPPPPLPPPPPPPLDAAPPLLSGLWAKYRRRVYVEDGDGRRCVVKCLVRNYRRSESPD